MKMESSALLANIGIILAKDLLTDEKSTQRNTPQNSFLYDFDECSNEAETFFLQQRNMKSYKTKKNINPPNPMQNDVNLLNLFDSKDFERNLHMEKKTFAHIFKKFSHLLSKNNSPTAMTILSLAIWKLATDEHFEQIARRFKISELFKNQKPQKSHINLFEVHNCIREFWWIISHDSKTFIEFPLKAEQMQQHALACEANNGLSRLPGMCAIIALKRLDIFLESNDEEVQIICQIIFNANLTILDCFVDLANDYSFESTPISRMLEAKGGIKPAGGYLIGDNNFPLKTYLICPFNKPETESECAFNSMLEPANVLAASIWDKMAKRFNALYALESKDLFEVRRIISTICVLHNICVEIGDNFVDQEQQNKTWSTSSTLNLCGTIKPSQAAIERRYNLLREIIRF